MTGDNLPPVVTSKADYPEPMELLRIVKWFSLVPEWHEDSAGFQLGKPRPTTDSSLYNQALTEAAHLYRLAVEFSPNFAIDSIDDQRGFEVEQDHIRMVRALWRDFPEGGNKVNIQKATVSFGFKTEEIFLKTLRTFYFPVITNGLLKDSEVCFSEDRLKIFRELRARWKKFTAKTRQKRQRSKVKPGRQDPEGLSNARQNSISEDEFLEWLINTLRELLITAKESQTNREMVSKNR